MGFLDKGQPIILKEGTSARQELAALQDLREQVPSSLRRQLDEDIRNLEAGIRGEDRILYELRNSHLDIVVLQDVFLEHEGLTAQIDFLVLTRRRDFVLECKNLYGNISVNERGDFVRHLGRGREEGIYSPITQNRRHLDLIHAIRKDSRSAAANFLVDKDFFDYWRGLVVLSNPRSVVDTSRAPEEVSRQIVRADQLVATIRAMNDEKGPGHDKVFMSTVQKEGQYYLNLCSENPTDYVARYREAADGQGGGRQSAGGAAMSTRPMGSVSSGSPSEKTKLIKLSASSIEAADGGAETPRMRDVIRARQAAKGLGTGVAARGTGEAVSAAGNDKVVGQSAPATVGPPSCPICGAPMVLRTVRRGERKGKKIWGCSNYPHCHGIINVE